MQVIDRNGRLKVEITSTVDDLSVGVTTISGGTSGRVLYDNAGVLGEIAGTSSQYIAGDGSLQTFPSGGGILNGTASGVDTYTTTITGVTAYNDGDPYLIRFTTGNTTGCTLDINGLGAKTLYRNNDGPLIGGDILDGGEMLCVYNSTLNGFQTIGTAPNTLLAYVTNAESTTITKGQVVYAFGGTGDRLKVKLAYNTSDATSAQTVGLVLSTSIAANQKGIIIVSGQLDGLSILPTSTWADGDPVYLGATAGSITKTKPKAPNHLVYLGFVTTANNGSAGRMYVRVQNGYELDELHDVQIISVANNDLIQYDSATSLWKNRSLSAAGIQPALSGTGFVKISGTTITYDNSTYYLASNPNGYTSNLGTVTNVSALTLGTSGTDLSSSVATGTTTPVITLNVPTASATNRGALSSTDWSTFNSKQDTLVSGTSIKTVNSTSLLGSGDVSVQATLVSGTNIKTVNSTSLLGSGDVSVGVTSVTGTSPISSSGGATPAISIATANTTTTGALSSTDWNTFNGKQNALTLTTTGTSGAATLVGSTLNIPQYSGGGGGGTIYKLTSQTLTAASWVLSGGYYTYTFSNVNITTNTRVDFTPDNASYTEVTNCGMTPQVTVAAGSCTFYSLFPPQNNITGEVTIFPTV